MLQLRHHCCRGDTASADPPDGGGCMTTSDHAHQSSTECSCDHIAALARIGDDLVQRVLAEPQFLDVLADRIADRVLANASITASDRESSTEVADDDTALDDAQSDAAAKLADYVLRKRPGLVSNDETRWARSVVAAIGTTADPMAVATWLCEATGSEFWSSLNEPLRPPRAARGNSRRRSGGLFQQMLAEYRAHLKTPDIASQIDQVVSEIHSTRKRYTGTEPTQQQHSARRNAHELLRTHSLSTIITATNHVMARRPHWRNTLVGVPTAGSFAKIHADWVSDGGRFEVPAEHEKDVDDICRGWSYHYAKRMQTTPTVYTDLSRRHVLDCLTGSDQADPIPHDTLRQYVMWLCDPGNSHTPYLVDAGTEFPPLAKIRRGLLHMSPPPGTRRSQVATTNAAASASGTIYGADVSGV